MLLGDFESANFRHSDEHLTPSLQMATSVEKILINIYFVGTTFFTQITFLNMLIAIMGGTFHKHSA